MKTPRHSITFFSFFPVVALLGAPLLFSTLAPASSQNFATEIDSFDWNVPQSQLVLEEFLRAQDVKNGEIEEVKFLEYGDSIYGGGENASSLISSSPAILDSGEIDTAYTLNNPEFQRQVEEVSAQAEKAGAAMPPLLTLVALFAFAVATGTSSLKDFVKFSTYTEKVKKTIQVTKKVAKTVYKTITETVARKVKTIKQVAYTAYETVKNVTYNTRTWVTEVMRYRPVSQVERTEKMFALFEKYKGLISGRGWNRLGFRIKDEKLWYQALRHPLARDISPSESARWLEQKYLDLQENIANHSFNAAVANIPYGTETGEKLREEVGRDIYGKYMAKITHSETTPIVTYTQKPYTAYRNEIETKIVYDTVTREVPETIYEDVTEDREITEDVTKHSFTPLNEKIDLAMGYLKNYSRILQNPSNRNFSDGVLVPNRDLSLFAGAYETYKQLGVELKTANIYNMDRTDPKEVEKLLKRHNEFIYSMKGILTKIQKGQTPEEQMTLLFGKDYTDSIRESENAIAETSAQEKALTARFNEIEELLRTNKISTGYYRSLYSSAKRNRDQLYRRKRDAEKDLKKAKEYYASKFNGTIASLQNLSFLRSLEDWRRTLAYGERSTASRLVPFTTANGSVIYRKANAQTTTQAQPKKTIPKPQPTNLQTAGPFDWLRNRKQRKIEAKRAEQKKEFLEYDRAKIDQTLERHSWKHSYSEEFYTTEDGLQVQRVQAPNLGKYFGADTVGTIEPEAIILHRTGGSSGLGLAKSWADFSPSESKKYMPAAHYLIDENGEVVKFADDTTRLFHVGKNKHDSSSKEKVAQIENGNAIGIEIVGLPQMVNGKLEYVEPNREQLDSLLLLVKDILKRNELTKNDIFAHPEVSAKNPMEGIHAKSYILKMLDDAN